DAVEIELSVEVPGLHLAVDSSKLRLDSGRDDELVARRDLASAAPLGGAAVIRPPFREREGEAEVLRVRPVSLEAVLVVVPGLDDPDSPQGLVGAALRWRRDRGRDDGRELPAGRSHDVA